MKKNILILLLGVMVTSLAFSQRNKKHHEPNPELKKEMETYIEKNVIPVLQKAQDEMDAQLSSDDLAFIQGVRKEVAVLKAQKKKEHKATKEERKAMKEKVESMTDEERKAFREEKKAKRKAMHEKRKNEKGDSKVEVKAFMERNQELITATMVSLKPSYAKWTTEQKAILQKYIPEDAPERRKMRKQMRVGLFGLKPHGKHQGHKGRRGGKFKGDKSDMKKEKRGEKHMHKKGKRVALEFVLWDGNSPTAQQREDQLSKDVAPNTKIELGQNYPNPAEGITRIPIDIPENVNQLNLIVTDLNGKVVKRLNFTNLSAGSEMIELDVNDLPNGQYFYTIETNGVKESKKMTVNH